MLSELSGKRLVLYEHTLVEQAQLSGMSSGIVDITCGRPTCYLSQNNTTTSKKCTKVDIYNKRSSCVLSHQSLLSSV